VAVYRSELACPYEPVSFFCDTEFALIVQEFGYGSEIRNVHSSLVHKEILGLDVPVNAACRMHLLNRFKHLHSDVRNDVLGDFFSVLSLLDELL
jgi:hypothetical protein